MPILWRHAALYYLRISLLSTLSFIAVLIIARFKDMARFAALSGDFVKTGLYLIYHIPTILPIVIPISALLASFLYIQNLSRSFELTALRCSGQSLKRILSPILCLSVFFSLLNFSICAEIAPFCRREGKTLIYHETSQNPLLLLQRQKLIKLKDAYLDMKVKNDETIQDLNLIVFNEKTNRLNLLSSRKLWLEKDELKGLDLAIISYLPGNQEFDSLIIENQSLMSTAAPLLSKALKKNRPRLDINALSLKMLRFDLSPAALIEFLSRISLTIAPFSLTFLGCSFGMDEKRVPSKKNIFFVLFFTLILLMSYLLGKELKYFPQTALLTFFAPHFLLCFLSIRRLQSIAKGYR